MSRNDKKAIGPITDPPAPIPSDRALRDRIIDAPVPFFLVMGRANTGKSEFVRLFIEFCDEAKVETKIIDLDTEKIIGSITKLYENSKPVIRLDTAVDGADVAEFIWPWILKVGKEGVPTFVDCPGSDLRLLDFAFKYDVLKLARHYNVEIIAVFVVSADKADWQYLEKLEKVHAISAKKILVFNEKFATRSLKATAQWAEFKKIPVVKRLVEAGAHVASIPDEEEIQKISHLPVHRGKVGLDNAESDALEVDHGVALWRQTQILAWYRAAKAEFAADAIAIRMPWH